MGLFPFASTVGTMWNSSPATARPWARTAGGTGDGPVAVGIELSARLTLVSSVFLAVSRRSIPLSQCCLAPEYSPVP